MKSQYLNAVLAIVCAVATSIGAQLKFNLGPIPYTMQNFGTVLAGLLLPARWAAVSQLIYIAMIALGLPVAAGFRGGIQVLIGYTAGYIWAFPIAAALVSVLVGRYLRLRHRDISTLRLVDIAAILFLTIVAVLPVYILGFTVFYLYAMAPAYKGLYTWSKSVVRVFLHLDVWNPMAICFIASVLIFIPQDLFMDHLAALLTASAVYRLLKARGMV